MAEVPIIVLVGQSNAAIAGIDNCLFELATSQGQAFEFVKLAVGDTSLFPRSGVLDWSPSTGELYTDLVRAVKAAITKVTASGNAPIVYTLWIHGERDVPEPYGSGYGEQLETFINSYRIDIGQTASTFCISLLRTATKVRTAQIEVASRLEHIITTDPLNAPTWDGAHFERPTQLMIAETFFAKAGIAIPSALTYDNGLSKTQTFTRNGLLNVVSPLYLDLTYVGDDKPVKVTSGTGDDTITTGVGNDLITTYGNEDVVRSGGGNDLIDLGTHDDEAWAGSGNDTVLGRDGRDVIYGEDGDDLLRGLDQADQLYGGLGNDVLDGGKGADTMTGGAGNDIYYVNETGDVIDDQGAPSDVDTVLVVATIQYTLAANVDNASLHEDSGDASLTGNTLANDLTGNDGSNALAGGAGNDTIDGGAGDDDVDGGTGNDVLVGGAGNDAIAGGTGVDTVDLTDAQGNVSVDLGTNRATGDGTDTLSGIENVVVGGGDDIVAGSADTNRLDGGAGNDNLNGGAGGDVLVGGGGNDTLTAGDGDDAVNAGTGDDVIVGGDGAGNDRYNGGAGIDTVRYTTAKAGIRVDLSAVKDQAGSIAAGDAAGIGVDQLSSIENVIAGKYADIVTGSSATNQLWGNGGNDTLNGGAGNDKLYGGAGRDTLTGGAGRDSFVFDTAPASRDTITDFSRADGDKIQLSKAVFKGFAYTGTLQAEDFYAAAGATTARDATDRVIYNTRTGILYYDADGLGGSAAVQIARLGTGSAPALAFADLLIVG